MHIPLLVAKDTSLSPLSLVFGNGRDTPRGDKHTYTHTHTHTHTFLCRHIQLLQSILMTTDILNCKHVTLLTSFEAYFKLMGQVYQQRYLSTMHVDITGALIGGVIGGSLVLSLVSISCSLVAVIILVLVGRRPTVSGGSVH